MGLAMVLSQQQKPFRGPEHNPGLLQLILLLLMSIVMKACKMFQVGNSDAGESLGQALDRAFAERIRLPEGDTVHAGAPIQDTRAAPIPGPPSPADAEGKPKAKGQPEKVEGGTEGDVEGPTETTAAGIAQAGHEQTAAVDPSTSSAADHSALPTGRVRV